MTDDDFGREHGRLRIPRSRGMVTGVLLIALGAWGALAPLVGPYFNFAFTPDDAFVFTAGRFWLEILPGLVTALGGLLLVTTANRAVAVLGGYLAVAAGAWFVVGLTVAPYLPDGWGDVGAPVGSQLTQMFEILSFFTGLGVLIVFLAAQALGRVTVRSVRDVAAVQRDHESRAVDRDRDDHRDRDVVDRQDARGRDDLADRDRVPRHVDAVGREDASRDVGPTNVDGGNTRVTRE